MLQSDLFAKGEVDAMRTASLFADADAMYERAPALFTTTAHPKMSERYAFTNTYDILTHIHNKGFKVSSVQGGQNKYAKVMVRMRHSAYDSRDEAPELIVIDSHDGSSRIKLCLGIIKFICMNGMIAGDVLYSKSFMHLAPDLMAQIMLEIDDIEQPINTLRERVQRMKDHKTNIGERIALADIAIRARFGEDRSVGFIADMRQRILHHRRREDASDDMYTVMNVIQENVIRGGFSYQTSGNSVRRLQDVRAVDRNININQAVWQGAEDLLKAA
jgi:hypothetical protein